MKHHLLQYDPETRLWSRPDLLPGHVFGQPEHALAFGHTDSRTPDPESADGNPDSGFRVRVSIDDGDRAAVEWLSRSGTPCGITVPASDLPVFLASLTDDAIHQPSTP